MEGTYLPSGIYAVNPAYTGQLFNALLSQPAGIAGRRTDSGARILLIMPKKHNDPTPFYPNIGEF